VLLVVVVVVALPLTTSPRPVFQDGGGSISKEELSDLMTMLNIKKTAEELNADMAEIDKDGNGEIVSDTTSPPPLPPPTTTLCGL